MNKVVKDLDVQFLTYGWWPTGENFETCVGQETGAFIVFGRRNENGFDFSSFKVKGFNQRANFSRMSDEEISAYRFVDQFSRLSWVLIMNWSRQFFTWQKIQARSLRKALLMIHDFAI